MSVNCTVLKWHLYTATIVGGGREVDSRDLRQETLYKMINNYLVIT